MSKKLVWLFTIVILALVGLAVRISYINATEGTDYARTVLSQTQQQYESRVIPFKRGDILDRNGNILATSEKVYNVILDCKVVNDTSQNDDGDEVRHYLEPTVKALVNVLHLDEADIRQRLEDEETRNSQYQVLKRAIPITERRAFEDYCDLDSEANKDLPDDEIRERRNIKGVWFEEDYLRVYPMGSQACDTIGFTYSDDSADWGIEGYYSEILNGVNGRQYGYFNTDADVEQTIIEPRDGYNIVSTIDINIQQIIRGAIEDFREEYQNGPKGPEAAKTIAVLAMNPNNGEILAMDSTGWYDLNDPWDLSALYTEEELKEIPETEQLALLNSMWRNYCISDSFEPGSTYKPMTAAAALALNDVTLTEEFYCDGYEVVGGQTIHCAVWPEAIHGSQILHDVLVNSCNDGIMQVANKVGVEEFLRYQELFHFGVKTGIDLPGESSGIVYSKDVMGSVELATSAFGQGFTCTMLQEAAAFSAIINGGYYYRPHVLRAVTDSSGGVIETMDSIVEDQVISSRVSDTLRSFLVDVCESGTGTIAKVEGYSMGGKTGTAQKIPRDSGDYLVSFIGFAPAENPQLVLYVIIDEPNVEDQATSLYAQKIAHNILEELLPYMNIFGSQSASGDTPGAQGTPQDEGISDNTVPAPLQEAADETVQNGGNDLFSDGITNEDQQLSD